MSNTRLTLGAVRAVITAGHSAISFVKKDGEFRITYKLEALARLHSDMDRNQLIIRAEELAAYETDLLAAYHTAIAFSESFKYDTAGPAA
jgi:hypothetical protein